MYSVKTKIAPGGFSVLVTTASPSRTQVDYFVVGSGGRQASGSVSLEGPGERFVHVDFPVLAVGVTDVEISEAPANQVTKLEHSSPMPAILGLVISSILSAGVIPNASVPDRSLQWRNAGIETFSPADDFTKNFQNAAFRPDMRGSYPKETFLASG
jgi:hypothetical protein